MTINDGYKKKISSDKNTVKREKEKPVRIQENRYGVLLIPIFEVPLSSYLPPPALPLTSPHLFPLADIK